MLLTQLVVATQALNRSADQILDGIREAIDMDCLGLFQGVGVFPAIGQIKYWIFTIGYGPLMTEASVWMSLFGGRSVTSVSVPEQVQVDTMSVPGNCPPSLGRTSHIVSI